MVKLGENYLRTEPNSLHGVRWWSSKLMYSEDSVVGKASTIGIVILPTPFLIFAGSPKLRNLAWWFHYSTLSRHRLKMQQGIRTLEQISRVGMIVLAKFSEVGSTHHWEPLGRNAPSPKIARRKRAKSSITQQRIIRFRSHFVQSLYTWHPKFCKSSTLKGQGSRSQRNITYQREKTL